MERCEEMKLGKKIIATVIAVVLVLTVSMVMASAADYTVKPGSSVNVVLSKACLLYTSPSPRDTR